MLVYGVVLSTESTGGSGRAGAIALAVALAIMATEWSVRPFREWHQGADLRLASRDGDDPE